MKIAVAQFEPRDADKSYNLSVITDLTRKAATAGAKVISFHEMCITAYTHTRNLDREALLNLAETESFDAQIATAQLDREKLELAGGTRYKRARKPSLYKNIIGRANRSRTIPHWMERETQTGSPDSQ